MTWQIKLSVTRARPSSDQCRVTESLIYTGVTVGRTGSFAKLRDVDLGATSRGGGNLLEASRETPISY